MYPLPQNRLKLWYLTVAIGLIIFTSILLSSMLKNLLPFISENTWAKIEEKKYFYLFFTFVLVQQILTVVSNTGAFEIYCEDKLIYSKIQTGEFPTMEILLKNLKEINTDIKKQKKLIAEMTSQLTANNDNDIKCLKEFKELLENMR